MLAILGATITIGAVSCQATSKPRAVETPVAVPFARGPASNGIIAANPIGDEVLYWAPARTEVILTFLESQNS